MGLMMPFMTLVMNGLNLLILWFGANLIENATIQVGDLMAVMQYGIEVVMSFLMISMIFVMLPRASVSAGRIDEVLKT
jgi:ATP-binding cassette subfamily B protein